MCSFSKNRAEGSPRSLFFTAPAARRLDSFLTGQSGLSRAQVKKLIDRGYVTVNDLGARASQRLRAGDRVKVCLPPPPPPTPPPQLPPVLYQDQDLLVVDKPAGLTVHPAPGHPQGTLVEALAAQFPDLAQMERAGIVHRLDKDTSGLLVVARNKGAWLDLCRQFQERQVGKGYLVLVRGQPPSQEGEIEASIARHPKHRQRMAVVAGGREARTRYKVLRYFKGYTLLEARPETGRTHQIRVHLSWAGYPVAGDKTYGAKSPLFPRQFLHAGFLRFCHPATGEWVEFTSPLPPDLQQALEKLSALPQA